MIAVLAGEGEDVKSASKGRSAPPRLRPPRRSPATPKPLHLHRWQREADRLPPAALRHRPHRSQRPRGRVFSSPLARRLAKEAGVDLARLSGSGPRGRVIARDIEAAKSGKGEGRGCRAGRRAALPPPMSDKQILALYEPGCYEIVPHDNMRRIIARGSPTRSRPFPHFYLTIDCDIGRLLAAREEINAAAPKDKDGKPAYKLSVNDFVIKALALALQRIPDANVSWTEGGMLKHKHSDIGVAVAMPGGLITPIIRKAETKSLSTISDEMKDFAARAGPASSSPRNIRAAPRPCPISACTASRISPP